MNHHSDIIISKNISNLVRNNQRDAACEILSATLVNHPHPELVILHIARLKFRSRDFEGALPLFEKIETHFQNSYKYWYLRGRTSFHLRLYNKTLTCLEKASQFHSLPKKETACYAMSAYKVGNFKLASELFSSIEAYTEGFYYLKNYRSFANALISNGNIEIDSEAEWAEPIVISGILYCKKNNLQASANILSNFLFNASKEAFNRAFFSNGMSDNPRKGRQALKEYVLSSEDLQKISDNSEPELTSAMANILFLTDLFDEASVLYAKLLPSKRLSACELNRAIWCFNNSNDNENLLTACSLLIKLEPEDRNVHFLLARIYGAQGDNKAATDHISIHLNLMPRDALAVLWLAKLAIENGRELYSEQQLVKAQEIFRNNSSKLKAAKKEFNRLSNLFRHTFGRKIRPNSTVADYSYIDWSLIKIPDEFKLEKNDIIKFKPKTNWLEVVKMFSTVLFALILREMTTRFGRNGLGYMWAVIQQVVFIGFFVLLFEIKDRQLPYGVSTLAFLITGINSFYIFRNTVSQIKKALKGNISLLYYRQVSPFSIYAARAVLETCTGIFIFALLSGILVASGGKISMTSLLEVLSILLLFGAFGACYGLFIATASTYIPAMDSFEAVIGRILFFTSGVFFYANELPTNVRELLLINPLFHLIELLREGFFDSYTANYASIEYVFGWALSLLFFALVLERVGRKRILEA